MISGTLVSPLPVFVTILSILVLLVVLKFRRSNGRYPIRPFPRDMVLLHQCGKGPHAPSLSPFIMKLETFLKVAQIPYQIVRDYKMGPKGKVPWMEYNGMVLCDSQLCMEYLIAELNLDVDAHLSTKERAVSTSFQRMADEHTYWLMVHWRWAIDKDKICFKEANWGIMALAVSAFLQKRATKTQGVGRHSKTEILKIIRRDFETFSNFLGTKKYFFGDRATCVDCSVFSQLSQFLWHLPNSEPQNILKNEFPNLVEYCHRMKDNFWPDWNENILISTDS
uniref:Failed axon connections homolog n=1 Tax=Crassostrea virginica TaxID=6565 RepID=A0A8B8CNM8_CRAVI|nr:failed axon connections homolog [Crassostrea virginica]